jgi:hypothetical protein
MGRVELPYVEGSTAIEGALEVMRQHHRSGIVTRRGDHAVVLTDVDLIDALRERGNLPVAEIEPVSPTIVMPEGISHHQVFQEMSTLEIVGDLLRSRGAYYAMDRVAGPTTWVVTIAEGVEQALNKKVVVCRCRKNPHQHVYRPAQVASGTCNRDGEPVDCG